jgi:chemosensory pili system protein ChpC
MSGEVQPVEHGLPGGEANELYSLLIPLRSERLLVPRMCVAEVISFAEATRDGEEDAPDWFVGTTDWNGRRIPVASFDPAVDDRPSQHRRTRVVVFHAITKVLKNGYYGILTQGFPQLVRVNAEVLGLESEQPLPPMWPALCRARMVHEYPVIPDLERIEQMIAELSGRY